MATYCNTLEGNMQYGYDPYCFTPSMCVCIFVYVCVYVCLYVCLYVCMYVFMYYCVYVYVCMYVCLYVCMCVCLSVCLCVHVCTIGKIHCWIFSCENCFALNCFRLLG